MTSEKKEILDLLSIYLEDNPDQRLSQALFNLGVNIFVDPENPSSADYRLRDIYNDTDAQVLSRIKERLLWFDNQKSD